MTTTTLAEFIERNKITLQATETDRNPHMADSENMDHWRVTLTCNRRTFTLYFSKGRGHHGAEPTADEVLDCLASDASGVDNARGFEDWASEYGYDTDSRKAEKIYKQCGKQAEKLKNLLGPATYQELLYETERL